jgi:iron complex outermembrane receptor protein
VFANRYDSLRSQEPTPPIGVPVVLDNRHHARTSGIEVAAHVDLGAALGVSGGYAFLRERFGFDAGSADTTRGVLEHNDPAHQVWVRASVDLPGALQADGTFRRVGRLPEPVVPAYHELSVRLARPLSRRLIVEIIGDNLLHDRHAEWFNLGLQYTVPRAVFARLTWQSQ